MGLHQIIYVSSACSLMREHELKGLLEQSRQCNASKQITGLLLYKEGNFMQLLEGDAAELNRLMDRIKEDRRHFGLSVLVEQPAADRLYPDWAMGYLSHKPEAVKGLPGYSDFLMRSAKAVNLKDRCSRMLRSFQRSM